MIVSGHTAAVGRDLDALQSGGLVSLQQKTCKVTVWEERKLVIQEQRFRF